jgi:hypothetical protein
MATHHGQNHTQTPCFSLPIGHEQTLPTFFFLVSSTSTFLSVHNPSNVSHGVLLSFPLTLPADSYLTVLWGGNLGPNIKGDPSPFRSQLNKFIRKGKIQNSKVQETKMKSFFFFLFLAILIAIFGL